MSDALLTASKSELLDKDGDIRLRGLLYDFFAFGRGLDAAREIFARFVDLSPAQYLIMIAIKNATTKDPIGVNQVAERLYLSGAFVTNELNKLTAEGLVEKNPHPEDGRRVQLKLTAHGVDLLVRLAALQRPVNDALFGMLTREEFKTLGQLLSRLAANSDNALSLATHIRATLSADGAARVARPSIKRKTVSPKRG